jgi:hypothetical protein
VGLIIAMSVYQVRPGTQRSVDELLRVATENADIEVVIFNKTGESLSDDTKSSNLSFRVIPPETFGETISRLEVQNDDNVIWCNDDDDFYFSESLTQIVGSLKLPVVGLPKMTIATSSEKISISWTRLIDAKGIRNRYVEYVVTGAPLIFSLIPGFLFNSWLTYIRDSPLKLPYFDTQLNLACLTMNSMREMSTHVYEYGAQNWETVNDYDSKLRWVRELDLDEDLISKLDICRLIENIVFISSMDCCDSEVRTKFLRVLVRQFYFMNDAQRQSLSINFRGRLFVLLFTVSPLIVRRFLLNSYRRYFLGTNSPSQKPLKLGDNIPRRIANIFNGLVQIKSAEEFEIVLSDDKLHEFLNLPKKHIDFWRMKYRTSVF